MTRFVLVTHGSRGDIDPFIALAAGLVPRAEVTVLTHAAYAASVRATGASFVAVDDEPGYERHLRRTRELIRAPDSGGMWDYYRDTDLFLDRVSLVGGFDQIRREVRMLLDGAGDIIVGRYTSCLSGLIAAELTGTPLCLVSLSPFQLATGPVTAMHLAHAASDQVNAVRRDFRLAPVTGWADWLRTADLTVGMWPRWFDEAGLSAGPDVVLTDFAYGDQRSPGSQAPPDLDDLADTVLLTGGTGRMIREDFYPAAIAGLVAAGRPGIVVTPHEDLLPRVLPGNVVHRRALPFAEVMPAVGAVVHHGGAGTIARAVRSAVPQLLLADGGDRPDNGQRLEKLDLARSLTADDWSATTIGTEINRMMTAERRAKAVAFAASTRQQGRTGPSLVDRLLTW